MKKISLFRGISARFMSIIFIGLMALTTAVGVGLWGFSKTSKTIQNLTEHQIPLTESIGKVEYHVNGIIKNVLAASATDDVSEKNKSLDLSVKNVEQLDIELASVAQHALGKVNQENLDNINKIWTADKPMLLKLIETIRKDEEKGKYLKIAVGLELASKALLTNITSISDANRSFNSSLSTEAINEISTDKNLIYAITAIAYIGLILFGIYISTKVSTNLSVISEGIDKSGTYVNQASQELSAASQALASSQAESSASLEEIVASLEELSSVVRLNSENAQQANNLSQKSKESVEMGEKEVGELIGSMSEIAHQSKKIEEIINVIDDIAFQTNLLALNASVEAARAGEQGRGFAVVADAVRSLAQRSASAAKDISNLIKESVEKSEHGATLAAHSGKVLQEILVSVKKVADLNGEIAAGSREQSIGIDQVSKAMNQIDQSTQQNAATAEEVSASSDELKSQSTQLTDLSRDLAILINGDQRTPQELAAAKT